MPLISAVEKVIVQGAREPGKQTRKRLLQCVSDTDFDDQNVVLSSGLVPALRSAHPLDATLIVKSIEAQLDERHPRIWDITFTYETVDPAKADDVANPTLRRWKVDWDTVTREVPLVYDVVTGKLVTNSAGDTFDPFPQVDRSNLEVTLTKAFTSIPAWLLDYADSVNDAAFTLRGISIGAGNARITKLKISDEQVEVQDDGSSLAFYALTINMLLVRNHVQRNPAATPRAGHIKRMLDEGLNRTYYDLFAASTAVPVKKKIHLPDDPLREPVNQPVPLDGNGDLLALSKLIGSGVNDGPVSLYFNGYIPLDYSFLGLPA